MKIDAISLREVLITRSDQDGAKFSWHITYKGNRCAIVLASKTAINVASFDI
jgi:hypothetical protein